MKKKLAIVTDAWLPQTSGVVTTLTRLVADLEDNRGYEILVIHPDLFNTFPCPTYPQIKLAYPSAKKLRGLLEDFDPDFIHIPVEGPIGLQCRKVCKKQDWRFTTSYTTKWPEYVYLRSGMPVGVGYSILRWFHKRSSAVSVATPSLKKELKEHGFKHLKYWGRGVDTDLFRPRSKLLHLDSPIMVYMGRVSVEKNVRTFLDLDIKGSKVVIGDGPDKESLEKEYPKVHFLGELHGEELAHKLASADVFVFPSLSDTFGIVLIEALKCNRENCRKAALNYTWEKSFDQFENLLVKKRKEK
jgi:glycosyltransferase involved in cell wall biosynthesis